MELHEDAVRRELILDADPITAWESVKDLGAWLADESDLDVTPGATGDLRDADGDVRHAVVEEVLPGRRIALRWWRDGEEPTIVELTLHPESDRTTRLVVVEVPVRVVSAIGQEIAGGMFSGPALVAA